MFDSYTLDFEKPGWLLLLLLIAPCFYLAWKSVGGLSATKAYVSFTLRTLVITCLAVAMAEPVWSKRGEGLTTVVLLDRSNSIPGRLKEESLEFLRAAAQQKPEDEDRVAVITIGKEASITAMPDRFSDVTPGQDAGDRTATNLAAGIKLALSIAPTDTANRLLLASDGNQNIGSVSEAADIARANGVPIDVLVIEYDFANEVIFDKIVTPSSRARVGQPINLKMVLRSQAEASGTVYLYINDERVALSGAPGGGYAVDLQAGVTPLTVPVTLETSGPHRFRAEFEADDPAQDRIETNNTAESVMFVSGEGKVLIVDEGFTQSAALAQALIESGIAVDVMGPEAIDSPVFLSGYDAVVLANIPRWSFDDDQDLMLHSYVHDLGGGLIMLGGDTSFGAGGWIDSQVARALPVKLDPPQTQQMLRGALALIVHSCEMAQGNYWGEQVAIAAIEALSRLDYVGLYEYGMGATSRAFPMQVAGDKRAAIAAAKKLVMGDMPDFGSAMRDAHTDLVNTDAGQKHMIIISDGDPSPPSQALVQKFINAQISVTTVMVGGHGTGMDRTRMQALANATNGRFYNVNNPMNLPQIFIKEAQVVSRSLIVEGDLFQPQVISGLPGPVESFRALPPIEGYILTAAREGLSQIPIVVTNSEGADPIYAFWNYGLGKSVAYTSDLTGKWGAATVSWADFRPFWERTVRWAMRPSGPVNIMVNTQRDGERAIVEIEAVDAEASFLNFLQTRAVVLSPGGEPQALSLQQTGPGKYRAEFSTEETGAYLINVNYSGGEGENEVRGSVQAAVAVPYAEEYRTVKHNAALLNELAERTGGRRIQATDPQLVNLFEREGLEPPKSPKHIWDFVLVLAASLFILDVASRRLAFDPRAISRMFNRLVGSREAKGDATLEAYKRARASAKTRRGEKDDAPTAAPADPSVRFDADEADPSVRMDVSGEADAAATGDRPARVERRAAPSEKPAADDEGESDYTSRLLRAKRRAKGEDGGGDGDDQTKGDGDA